MSICDLFFEYYCPYPLMTHVLKFEYVKPQNFKYGTTVECAKKLTHS